jgi:hypothetical protein
LKFDEGAPGTSEVFINFYSSRNYIFIAISYLISRCVLAGAKHDKAGTWLVLWASIFPRNDVWMLGAQLFSYFSVYMSWFTTLAGIQFVKYAYWWRLKSLLPYLFCSLWITKNQPLLPCLFCSHVHRHVVLSSWEE